MRYFNFLTCISLLLLCSCKGMIHENKNMLNSNSNVPVWESNNIKASLNNLDLTNRTSINEMNAFFPNLFLGTWLAVDVKSNIWSNNNKLDKYISKLFSETLANIGYTVHDSGIAEELYVSKGNLFQIDSDLHQSVSKGYINFNRGRVCFNSMVGGHDIQYSYKISEKDLILVAYIEENKYLQNRIQQAIKKERHFQDINIHEVNFNKSNVMITLHKRGN